MRPSPQEQAHRLREMAAIIRATAPAGRYRQTTLVPATYMEWAADTIEELLGRVVETCAGCCAPTCANCYLDCNICGKQYCQRCVGQICPEHQDFEDQRAAVQEVLAAEGFEDVGSAELVADWTSCDLALLRDCEANEWIEVRYLRGGCSGTFTHSVHTVLALDELLDDVPLADVEHIHLMRTLLDCPACNDVRSVSCEQCGRVST